jgi:hypothetical protein
VPARKAPASAGAGVTFLQHFTMVYEGRTGTVPRARAVAGRKNPDALCRSAPGPSESRWRATWGARHASQHSVFWQFGLRVRQCAKGGAPRYGAPYRCVSGNRSPSKRMANASASSGLVKQSTTNSPSSRSGNTAAAPLTETPQSSRRSRCSSRRVLCRPTTLCVIGSPYGAQCWSGAPSAATARP